MGLRPKGRKPLERVAVERALQANRELIPLFAGGEGILLLHLGRGELVEHLLPQLVELIGVHGLRLLLGRLGRRGQGTCRNPCNPTHAHEAVTLPSRNRPSEL